MCLWSLGFFSYPEIAPVMSLTRNFYSKKAHIKIAIVLSSVIMIYRNFIKVLKFIPIMYSL